MYSWPHSLQRKFFIEPGDLLAIHDTGAHGHAMGFNYNGKLRSAEWLVMPDGAPRLIRRAETLDDLFATLVPPVRARESGEHSERRI